MIHQRKIIKAIAYAILLCFTSLTGAQPLYAIPANTQLPTLDPNVDPIGATVPGANQITGNTMNIQQTAETSIIKWQDFSIGADATVNFNYNGEGGFNSLNYVMNGPVSEIYGQLTALGGNIFIANPAGVQIGNSAQINVGSLYVTNKDVGSVLTEKDNYTLDDITSAINSAKVADTNAELMSLGSIISTNNNVTFDGNRIVIDTERLYTNEDGTKMRGLDEKGVSSGNTNDIGGLTIKTDNTNDVILGYDGTKDEDGNTIITGDISFKLGDESTPFGNTDTTTYHGYQWIRDLFQLQDIANTESLDGWYALRNSIDASYTENENYTSGIGGDTKGSGFRPIGGYYGADNTERKSFTGRFDGLGYNIFGLNIDRPGDNNIGLFGYVGRNDVNDPVAYVRNFTINSGSINGYNSVGSAIGTAVYGTVVENIINTADITGNNSVGGIIGIMTSNTSESAYSSGHMSDLINIGTVSGYASVGGIIGYLLNSILDGTTYNLGAVSGKDGDWQGTHGEKEQSRNIGGIAGWSSNSTIGNDGDGFQIYNQAAVTGGYNVGGIVGSLTSKSSVTNVANHGTITATGYSSSYSDGNYYQYHTAEKNKDNIGGEQVVNGNDQINKLDNGLVTVAVNVANAGGIVGKANDAEITNVLNDGDVTAARNDTDEYHIAGNVGGVVGRAQDTTITNATNRENSVAGAHNVGGVAGLLYDSSVTNGTNDGGDITGTGARYGEGEDNTVSERVRPQTTQTRPTVVDEVFTVGNIGGIAGYMYDSKMKTTQDGTTVSIGAFIDNSTNRGTVHSELITDKNNVPETAKAANVGGIVGKVDMKDNQSMSDVTPGQTGQIAGTDDYAKVSIRHSYNTGDVQGYTGVGGIAGMMYNGSVARSFNMGTLSATRQSEHDSREALNMGGIVGDTTEETSARTMIYDVYNAGQIGDDTFQLYGRHVGGVVGRLSGNIDKAYNTGDIYNGFSTVGGVVGYWNAGNISNVFNTGDITVVNNDWNNYTSEVGGIVGSFYNDTYNSTLEYAYNLGTLRSFTPYETYKKDKINSVSGILGSLNIGGKLSISNVYTLGNLYTAEQAAKDGDYVNKYGEEIHKIYYGGHGNYGPSNNSLNAQQNTFYIEPENSDVFSVLKSGAAPNIAWDERSDPGAYKSDTDYQHNMTSDIYNAKANMGITDDGHTKKIPEGENEQHWRIYDGTPILNVFLPYAEDFFSGATEAGKEYKIPGNVESIQFGTAYNPLITIVNFKDGSNGTLNLDWGDLGITSTAGLAVYNGSLNLIDFQNNGDYYFGGTIYADGGLTVTAPEMTDDDKSQFVISDGAKLYGSSVTVDTKGRGALISGSITATGRNGGGDIEITTGEKDGGRSEADIEILGSLTSANGDAVTVESIRGQRDDSKGWNSDQSSVLKTLLNDPLTKELPSYKNIYSYTTDGEGVIISKGGKIDVTTGGSASILYGNMEIGAINSDGDFSVTADKGIHLDSAMNLGGNLNLTSDGEIVLDFASDGSIEHIHDFVGHFNKKETEYAVNIKGGGNFIIGLDMWNDEEGTFDINKFDKDDSFGSAAELEEGLDAMNVRRLNDEGDVDASFEYRADENVYLWIEDAYQLKGIQDYIADTENNSQEFRDAFLRYNFALKNDIDASVLKDKNGNSTFTSIGTGTDGFYGVFDGRGFRILGLTANGEDAGLFSKLTSEYDEISGRNRTATIRDLRVYSSNFSGTNSAGAIAGVNEGGVISGVTTLGNYVEATGKDGADTGVQDVRGAAGGIVGINKGEIKGSDASDVVVAGGANVTAGGVAGVNDTNGLIGAKFENGGFVTAEGKTAEDYLVTADSAVTANAGGIFSIGGAVGVNKGEANLLNSTGVTNGRSGTDAYNVDKNVGGVVGLNDGDMTSLYNESIVMGKDNVGGVAGTNEGNMSNAVNATSVTADGTTYGDTDDDKAKGNVGGIAGVNSGTIDSGRNAGVVTGGQNVGGMVGANDNGILSNLSNALAAVINGVKHVGGIAGTNSGNITGSDNLLNEGAIRGNTYVGGVAGLNTGTIQNTNTASKIEATGTNAKYFGGVTGDNQGTISDVMNTSDLTVTGGNYVGGITGRNYGENAKFEGDLINEGNVSGATNVGGIVGKNEDTSGVLKGEEGEEGRLYVANRGNVSANNGGAAGIFYENTDDIENATIENTGVINGYADGSGGENTGALFGVNTGNITNSTLKNSGEVTGGKNTGGLIGKNTGDISYSSLINEVGAKVEGGENTGGLIGYNIGKIDGGRKNADGEDLGLYTYKIYNNGEVTGTTNVGGLIGYNTTNTTIDGTPYNGEGSLTAGYNTGVVTGSGENVGGIAGTNAGIIDQVFNTVMTALGTGEKVSGNNNVGGIVGSNTGTLTNAYNTTGVTATGVKGSIVGSNEGKVTNVYNVYATEDATNGKNVALIGGSNNSGKEFNGYNFAAGSDEAKKRESYGGFEFSESSDDDKTWKIYEGHSTPLLKVFLTKAEYDGTQETLTYEAKNQNASVDFVTAFDDKAAYENENSLLTAISGYNAGTYNAFYSGQIAASGTGDDFNPNNLGYDIDSTFTINKAKLNVTLDDISRTYGDANITNNNTATDNGHYLDGNGYGYTVSAANEMTEEMIAELGGEGFYTFVEDGAVKGVSGQKETNDVKGYTWSATFNLGDLSNNYEFADGESTLSLNKGVSNVTKADLHVTLDEAKHTYGNTAVTNNGGAYAIKGDEVTFLNGDEWTVGDLVVTKTEDTALTGDEIRVTENAGGDYKWNGTVVGKDGTNIDQNYNIIIDNAEQGATSTVEQAEITIALDEVQRTYGDTSITNNNGKYTFQFADGTRLVNGDEGLAINPEKIVDNALYYDKNAEETRTQNVKKDDYTWTVDKSDFTGVDDFLTNYDVTVKDGTSIVNQKELTVNDVAASIVYGNQGDRGFKLFDEDGIVSGGLNGIAYGDDVRLNVDFSDISEENLTGEYANNRDGRITANVGTYEDSLIFSGLALTGDSKKIGNYKLASDWAGGKIRVDKANLKITLEDIVREYGTLKPEEGSYGYAAEGLANEDKLTFNDDIAQSLDGALVWKGNELRTNDKGDYSYSDGIEKAFEGFNFGNYGYTIEGGSSEVTPRKISISDIYASIVYGMQDGKGFVIDRGGSLGERAYADDDLNLSYELSLGDGNFDASGVYMTNKDGRKTADVGFYGSEKLTFDGLTLSGEQAGNYELVSNTVNGYITVTPATLYVTLSDVKHTYGDTSLDDDTKYGIDGFSGLVNDDDKNPGYTKDKIFGELSDIDDDALTDDGITKDANPNGESYTWTAKVSTVVDKLSQNYKIEVIDGKSTVGKAKLVVNVNNVDTIYGTQFDKDKYGYVFDENFGLVNNDNEETIRGALGITADDYHNEAEKDGAGGVWTDGYKDDGYEITLNKQVNLTNYEVEYRAGEATVTKADLTIKADDQNMLIGTTPNFTGTTLTELANQLVNGDSLPDGFGYEFGLEDESILDVIGTHPGVIGLLLGGRFYDGGKYEDWGNTVNAVFANYNVNVEPGLLTIVPPSNSNYGHLHSDGWDRLRNFRERKAEVFFHEGGMEYDEDM